MLNRHILARPPPDRWVYNEFCQPPPARRRNGRRARAPRYRRDSQLLKTADRNRAEHLVGGNRKTSAAFRWASIICGLPRQAGRRARGTHRRQQIARHRNLRPRSSALPGARASVGRDWSKSLISSINPAGVMPQIASGEKTLSRSATAPTSLPSIRRGCRSSRRPHWSARLCRPFCPESRPAGAPGVLPNPHDFDGDRLGLRAGKYRPGSGLHARAQIRSFEDIHLADLRSSGAGSAAPGGKRSAAKDSPTAAMRCFIGFGWSVTTIVLWPGAAFRLLRMLAPFDFPPGNAVGCECGVEQSGSSLV